MAPGIPFCSSCRVYLEYNPKVPESNLEWYCPICGETEINYIWPSKAISREFKENLRFYKFVKGIDSE